MITRVINVSKFNINTFIKSNMRILILSVNPAITQQCPLFPSPSLNPVQNQVIHLVIMSLWPPTFQKVSAAFHIFYDTDILKDQLLSPTFLIEHPSFKICMTFPNDQIEVIYYQPNSTQVVSHVSFSGHHICKHAHDIYLSSNGDLNFDHLVKVLSNFSTIQ